jgi:GNAT superfamily N-acetyltransferase
VFTVTAHADAEGYLAAALGTLERSEVANGLVLGVPLRLRLHPERFTITPYLATVHDAQGALAGAAVRTPPYHLVVHVEDAVAAQAAGDAVIEALLADVQARRVAPNGVNGRVPWSEAFARCWEQAAGVRARLTTALRAFELRAVVPPEPCPGAVRKAGPEDFDAVRRFLYAFDAEALPNEPTTRSDDSIRLMLGDGGIYLWVLPGGEPVCLVAKSRPLLHGITIAPVYTPPEQRGRGYASNCVAAVSRLLLDAGWQYVTLFTDLANPTSNSIYQKVGYRPVCDYADFAFTA